MIFFFFNLKVVIMVTDFMVVFIPLLEYLCMYVDTGHTVLVSESISRSIISLQIVL